ncbi:hypothetical protein G6F37_009363 [Rhizopus arrhizus]|nr:hypothetical protein G6F38_009444 [Rhizopus arrhizus]KAG1154532.1 hypothetical protein G6F37_009363 [Rhizopus arrhizus]
MFGALSIMKHIVSKYKHASFDTSRALVVHAIHVHGSAVRHWLTRFPEGKISLTTKLSRSEMPLKLNNDGQKVNSLRYFIQLHLNLTLQGAIEEIMNVLRQLEIEHRVYSNDHNSTPDLTLEGYVDPLVVRLNEKKRAKGLEMDGPQSP